jgi:succinate dehydrogenase hydrophobic anchor subunit
MLLMLMMRLRLKTRLKIRMVVQKKCPRARFYAQDIRQQITAIALAIVTRFFAAATMRKLQRVAIHQVPSPLMVVVMLLMLMLRLRLKTRLEIRMVVQKKCPRARFYAQDFRQQITAIALAIVTRFFAAATMRKLQRVAIHQVPSPLMVVEVPRPRPRMVVEVPRPVVQKKCPRGDFMPRISDSKLLQLRWRL